MELTIKGTVDELAAFVDAVIDKLGLDAAQQAGLWSLKDEPKPEPKKMALVKKKPKEMPCVTLFTAYEVESGEIIMEDTIRGFVERAAMKFADKYEGCRIGMFARTLFEDGTEIMEYSDGKRSRSIGHRYDYQQAVEKHKLAIRLDSPETVKALKD